MSEPRPKRDSMSLEEATISVAANFSSRVVSVLDGDTLEVLHDNKAERIR
ncbi:MAG: hypothetical protein ACT4OL_07840 [Nitrospiraceae bacterium]